MAARAHRGLPVEVGNPHFDLLASADDFIGTLHHREPPAPARRSQRPGDRVASQRKLLEIRNNRPPKVGRYPPKRL